MTTVQGVLDRVEAPSRGVEGTVADPFAGQGGSVGRLLLRLGRGEARTGHLERAIGSFDRALPHLLEAGDDRSCASLLAARGMVRARRGELSAAERDLLDGRHLALGLGQPALTAEISHGLGLVHGWSGDLPSAFAWFDEARRGYECSATSGRAVDLFEADVCGVLLTSGLVLEARAAACRAARAASRSRDQASRAEAHLLLARVHLAEGGRAEASREASLAVDLCRALGREPWVALAEFVGIRAAAEGDADDAGLVDRAEAVLPPLTDDGWVIEAHEVRTFIGDIAVRTGRLDLARSMLEDAADARTAGPPSLRAGAWRATASLALAEDDRAGARAALHEGMGVIESLRASLGATDVRAQVSAQGLGLVTLGLEMALADGSASGVLDWAERSHAGSMDLAPVHRNPDGRLSTLLAELRAEHTRAGQGEQCEADRDGGWAIGRIESAVRAVNRATPRQLHGGTSRCPVDRHHLADRLGEQVLVEYVPIGRHLHAVVVVDGTTEMHPLVPLTGLEERVHQLSAALRRLAFAGTRPQGLEAARTGLEQVGRHLDRMLVEPLGIAGARPVVIVPTGALQSLPWSVLPTLQDRAVVVSPSAALWSRDPVARGHRDRVVLVAGPGLEHADEEVERLHTLYRDAVVLHHPDATVARVLEAMASADLVHLAAHGTFRVDSPLFSALHLSDGPLTVYDLEHLPVAPSTVVVPACEAGRHAVRGGDELLGMASALLQLGVGAVIAPVSAVPDETVVPLMVDLHHGLRRGLTPAAALADATARAVARGTPGDIAAARAFVTVGARAEPSVPPRR